MARTRIVLYEYATSGGLQAGNPGDARYLAEGHAMARALAEDFARGGCETRLLLDANVGQRGPAIPDVEPLLVETLQERSRLQEAASQADWTMVIAPECDGLLAERYRWVEQAGGRWLGCGPETLAMAADKQRTAEHLRQQGVPAPPGWVLSAGAAWPEECPLPAVIKPVDGAGSQGVRRLERALQARERAELPRGDWRVEPLIEGLAASVGVLCGPRTRVPLVPCRQEVACDDRGALTYAGGSLPLPPELARRATQLAMAAIEVLPDPHGYVGVDLILGAHEAGDVVVEINPRLTTSYVGLRAACRGNLALAMVSIARGEERFSIEFDDAPIQFRADGAFLRGASCELAGA